MKHRRTIAKLILTAAILTGVAGLARAEDEAAGVLEVRVMTFNVKQQNPRNKQSKEEATHWERRRPLAVGVIRRHAPDIVGLQEPYRAQIDDLRKALPRFGEVGIGRRGESRDEHCSILYRKDRFRVVDSGTFWLSETPEKVGSTWGHFYPRICTWARFFDKKSERFFHVYNTHLDHQSQPAREKAVRLIARRIRDRGHQDPFILTGDFNAGEQNPVVTYLKGRHAEASPVPVVDSFRVVHPEEKTVGTGNHFDGKIDGEKIDYIFVPPGTEVLEAAVVRTRQDGVYPSDHFPVTARIRFGKNAH